MLRLSLLLVSIQLFISQRNFSQNILNPKWTKFVEDKTILPQYQKRGETKFVFQDNTDLITISSCFQGWTINKINPNNGDIVWTNSQNQNFPDSTNKIYELLFAKQLSDNTIEIIGKKDYGKFPGLGFAGFLLRIIYDNKTGKELFRSTKTVNSKDFVETYGGTLNPIIPFNGEYRIFDVVPLSSSNLRIRSFDKNMTYLKTLNDFKAIINDNILGLSHISTTVNYDKDNIYSFTYLYGGLKDTFSYRNIFRKFDMNGKVKLQKDISKDLFYDLEYFTYNKVSDGFLVSGYVDTALTLINKQKTPKWVTSIFKFDTLGNKTWSSYLPDTLNSLYQTIATCEDKKRNGYWAFVGRSYNTAKKYPEIFFINNNGNFQKIAKIVVKNDNTKYESKEIWVSNQGDLILSLQEQSCNNDFNPLHCRRLAFIEGKDIDFILNNDESYKNPLFDLITLFPNPVSNNLKVKFNQPLTDIKVSIFSLEGKSIFNKNFINEQDIDLDISSLASGFYILNIIKQGQNIYSQKFIKI